MLTMPMLPGAAPTNRQNTLTTTDGEVNLLLFGDSDLLSDQLWVQIQEFHLLGISQRIPNPLRQQPGPWSSTRWIISPATRPSSASAAAPSTRAPSTGSKNCNARPMPASASNRKNCNSKWPQPKPRSSASA